jgi:hypothetical protein
MSESNWSEDALNAIVQYHMKQLGRLPCQKTQSFRRVPIVKRTRRPVCEIYRELGKTYFKRAYRMGYRTFKKLFRTIAPKLKMLRADKNSTNYVPNGRIHSTVFSSTTHPLILVKRSDRDWVVVNCFQSLSFKHPEFHVDTIIQKYPSIISVDGNDRTLHSFVHSK